VANVEFRILGPLEAVVDGRPVPLGGPKQRSLLALLLVRAGNVVSADQLIDEIWGADAPPTVRAGLHVYLSRLRRLLGSNGSDGVLVRHAHGYALMLGRDQLDATRFEQLAREGREALGRDEATRAADVLSDALSMWRGPALADLAHVPFAEAEAGRLEDLRLQAVETRIAADLRLGRASEVVGELQTLIAAHPYREGLRGQLMLALYQLGRQADALEAYARARRVLRDELGLEPSQELRQLEQAILQQDDALDAAPAVVGVEREPAPPTRRSRDRRSLAYLAAGAALATVALVTLALAPWNDDRLRVPDDAVGAIDPASNRVVATIPVGAHPAAVAADGATLWVANALDGSVSRIDLRRRRTVRAVAVGGNPGSLTVSSSSVWVPTGERMRRIDPRFDTVVNSVAVGRGSWWARASVPSARRGRTVWVGDGYGVAQIDERTNKVVRRVATGDSPSGIATHGDDVWVSDNVDNTVTRIEPTNATTVLPVGREPNGIAAAAGALWVAQTGDNSVVRIDPDDGNVVTTIPVGRGPTSVADGAGSIWVTNSGDGTVTRIDPDDNRVVTTVEVGGRPQGIVFADGLIWVANRGAPAAGPLEVRGGTARFVGHADIDAFPEGLSSLDPAVSFNSDVWKLFYATCAKLVNYVDARAPAGSQLVPEVAAAMPSISQDRRTYTFTIRDGFRFSPPSDAPVTAATFKHTIERTLHPKLRSPAVEGLLRDVVGQSAYAAGRTSHLHGVAARGNRLTITLTRPDPAFLAKMATPFFCAVPTDTPMQPVGPRPIPSAGPYSFAEHVPHQRVVLTRNPNYAGDRPQRLERAVYTFGASSTREIARDVEAGRADYALDGIDDADEARLVARYGDDIRRGRPTLVRNATGGVAYLILNATRPLFGSTRLRRAVNFAIDRTALTAALPGGTPTDQYLPPTIPGYRDARVYPFRPDVARATRLAGTVRRTAVMYTCNERWCRTVAQILRRDLRRLGIDVRIEQFPFAELYDRENTPGEPFDIGFLRWAPAIVDPGDVLDPLDGSPFFRDETWLARLRAARTLTGGARYRAYGALDVALARDAAPFAAFAVLTQGEFFSARLGCQIAHPVYGIDIAALCLRSRTEGG
jgi:YVTN family beta-propeller protein